MNTNLTKSLNSYLLEARKTSTAIGHFNFATEDVAKGIVEACVGAGAPCVMLGTSEGEADFVGMPEAVGIIQGLRKDFNFAVFLNADHFKSFEKCKEAIDAGYDSIGFDGSRLPVEENILMTSQVINYARDASKFRNIEISVEGELGYLRGLSEVQAKIEISSADYTQPEEALRFIQQTGVDRFAPVFGNIHGIVTDQEEKLDIGHLKKIIAHVEGNPPHVMVLHGASGLEDQDVKEAIMAGISNVHFNTEIRIAYHDALEKTLESNPLETTPYKFLAPSIEEVKKLITAKLKLFDN